MKRDSPEQGTLGVLSNDIDADDDTLTTTSASDVSHGAPSLNVDILFIHEHHGSENHGDEFTYLAVGGQADSDTITVSFVITLVNDALALTSTPIEAAAEDAAHTYSVTTSTRTLAKH